MQLFESAPSCGRMPTIARARGSNLTGASGSLPEPATIRCSWRSSSWRPRRASVCHQRPPLSTACWRTAAATKPGLIQHERPPSTAHSVAAIWGLLATELLSRRTSRAHRHQSWTAKRKGRPLIGLTTSPGDRCNRLLRVATTPGGQRHRNQDGVPSVHGASPNSDTSIAADRAIHRQARALRRTRSRVGNHDHCLL